MIEITQRAISLHVAHAFGTGAVHRDAVIAAARATGAHRELLEFLERLPPYRYQRLDQLWKQLPPIAKE